MTKNKIFSNQVKNYPYSSFQFLFGLILILVPGFSYAASCDFKNGEISNSICGYVKAADIYTGGQMTVHVSSAKSNFQVTVKRVGSTSATQTSSFSGAVNYPMPTDGSSLNWGAGYAIDIPSAWNSGLYKLTFTNSVGSSEEYLTIRENQPGSKAKVLILNGDTTKLAYSPIAGKSLYSFNSEGGVPATNVSLNRPVGIGTWTEYVQFISWINAQGIAYESASMMDVHRLPTLLENYDLVIIPDHNEYWTGEMREVWDQYLAKGGNAAILSGNTMWWQIRLEGEQMVCYKNPSRDPLYGVDDARVTGKWYAAPVNRPENTSTGVSFRHAGYHNYESFYPVGANATNGKYQVQDASHWAFTGTGLSDGDYFGNAIVGYETDGALFSLVKGKPVVTGLDGTPTNFQILGLAPAYAYDSPSFIPDYVPGNYQEHGWSTMGIFRPVVGGGTVFVAPTIGWPHGLTEAAVSRITLNVLNKLKVRTVGTSTTGNTGGATDSSGGGDAGNTGGATGGSTDGDTGSTGNAANPGGTANTGGATAPATSTPATSSSASTGSGGGGSFPAWALLYALLAVGLVACRYRLPADARAIS